MYAIEFTRKYLKDLKLARKRQLPEDELNKVIKMLSEGKTLPAKYKTMHCRGVTSDCGNVTLNQIGY